METQNTQQVSSRLRERLSEPAMLELAKRLIAIPSENPPGHHYEGCACTLFNELVRLGFDEVGVKAHVYSHRSEPGREPFISAAITTLFLRRAAINFSPRVKGANLCGRGSSDMKSAWRR